MVDLKELGFDGTEPAILQLARGAVKNEEPAIWDSVLSDPLARKYMVRGCMDVCLHVCGFGVAAVGPERRGNSNI